MIITFVFEKNANAKLAKIAEHRPLITNICFADLHGRRDALSIAEDFVQVFRALKRDFFCQSVSLEIYV
jgi:hypothetical protein